MRGRVQYDPSIWCGICGDWDWLDKAHNETIRKAARSAGWKYTKLDGWVCPKCQKRRNDPVS